MEGDTSQDIKRLLEGDTIFYPLIEDTVRIDGSVQRPGNYEILDGSTLSQAMKFSGLQTKGLIKIQFSSFEKEFKPKRS